MDDDDDLPPVEYLPVGEWDSEVQSVITWLLSGEGDERRARTALIRMLSGNLPPDVQTALALAFNRHDGKTLLTLGHRGKSKPVDPIEKTIRMAVIGQLAGWIASGQNRQAAIDRVGKALRLSRHSIEKLLSEHSKL